MLTCAEAAERLRIKTHTLYDWLRAGKLEYVQVGSKKMLTEEALEKFITQNTVKEKRGGGRPKTTGIGS